MSASPGRARLRTSDVPPAAPLARGERWAQLQPRVAARTVDDQVVGWSVWNDAPAGPPVLGSIRPERGGIRFVAHTSVFDGRELGKFLDVDAAVREIVRAARNPRQPVEKKKR